MRVNPLISLVLAALWLPTACWETDRTVPRSEYEALKADYDLLKAGAEATRQDYIDQADAVDAILQELSRISGKTVALRDGVERGTARLTQVEQIENSIGDIKQQLERLDSLTRSDAKKRQLVNSLRKVIAEKEQEIEALRADIHDRDLQIDRQSRTIDEQHGTIQTQHETISAQQETLRQAVQEQARLLYQAGEDFEALGDASPTVSRRRDRARVKSLTAEMYEKAVLYYGKAQEAGYPEAAYRMTAVQEKLDRLDNSR